MTYSEIAERLHTKEDIVAFLEEFGEQFQRKQKGLQDIIHYLEERRDELLRERSVQAELKWHRKLLENDLKEAKQTIGKLEAKIEELEASRGVINAIEVLPVPTARA